MTETATGRSEDIGLDGSSATTWWQRSWPYIVVALVALVASSLHVAKYTTLSPYDESRHVDYMVRIFDDGYMVKQGDKLAETAMRLESCRGVDVEGYTPPPCDASPLRPADFRDDGFNNAINHPPGYYVITGVVAEAATKLGVSNNVLDPARLVGGLWLAAGLALAVYAGELLRLNRVALAAVATLFALAPEPLFLSGTVNPDAASIFAGALVFVLALLWERGRVSMWWLGAAGVFVALLKMTNLIAVGIVVAWLLVHAYATWRGSVTSTRSPRDCLVAVVVLLVSSIGVSLLWALIAGARATVDALRLPSNRRFYEPGFPFRALVYPPNLYSLFPPLGEYRAPAQRTDGVRDITMVISWLAIAAMLANALRYSVRDRISTLGLFTGALLVAAGPAFIASTWFVNRVIFEPAPRYGMSAIPMLVVLAAALVKGRPATIAIAATAGLSAAVILSTLAFG